MTIVIGIDPHKASHTATAIGPGSVEAATIRLRAARSTPQELLSGGGPVARASLGD